VGFVVSDWKKAAADAWDSPGWKKAAREYREAHGNRAVVEIDHGHLALLRRLMSDDISLSRAQYEINRAAGERRSGAPETVYNAVMHELRVHGVAQLGKPDCQRRLADLSDAQLRMLLGSLQRKRGQYPAISDELLTALAEIYHDRMTCNG
jgi:hypothetical protein